MTLNELLTKHRACDEAVAWAATQPNLAAAWRKCTRIDWMCWIAGRVIDDRTMRHLACDFAESAFEHAGDEETLLQCILTVEISRRFADGAEDTETRVAADDAARAAAWSAGWSAGAAARAAAWSAAGDADDAAWSAWATWSAEWAALAGAEWAAGAAAGNAALAAANRQHLRIMRKRITAAMICKAAGVK